MYVMSGYVLQLRLTLTNANEIRQLTMQISEETVWRIGVMEVQRMFIGVLSESFQHVRGCLLNTCVNILEGKNKRSASRCRLLLRSVNKIYILQYINIHYLYFYNGQLQYLFYTGEFTFESKHAARYPNALSMSLQHARTYGVQLQCHERPYVDGPSKNIRL